MDQIVSTKFKNMEQITPERVLELPMIRDHVANRSSADGLVDLILSSRSLAEAACPVFRQRLTRVNKLRDLALKGHVPPKISIQLDWSTPLDVYHFECTIMTVDSWKDFSLTAIPEDYNSMLQIYRKGIRHIEIPRVHLDETGSNTHLQPISDFIVKRASLYITGCTNIMNVQINSTHFGFTRPFFWDLETSVKNRLFELFPADVYKEFNEIKLGFWAFHRSS